MAERLEIYKCELCGNIIEVLDRKSGDIVCCGQPMQLMAEKTQDQGNEKHVPVIESTSNGVKVKVGSVQHPMEEKHFIQWIEVETKDQTYRKFLTPGELPEAEFCVDKKDIIKVRELCNLHGLWKA